ncbi:MAG: type II secretion system protein GspG [Thermoguttaceae bacterium]|nr:type II secretion system protein GspG [Thermoguttaceae bacterium]
MKRVASLDSKKSGFTLLELLIVLAILIVIIGILGTTVWNSYKRALIRAATVQVTNTLVSAVDQFNMEQGSYPTMVEGLYILANMDNPDAASAMQMQMQQQATGMAGQTGMNNMTGMNAGMPGMTDPNMMNTGMVDPMTGMPQTGMQQPGMVDPMTGVPQTGMQQPGMVDPMTGMPQTGMQQPGMVDPMTGMQQPGMVDPMTGMQQPGMVDPTTGMQQPGMVDPMTGMSQTGMQQLGATGMQQTTTVNSAKPIRKIPEPYVNEKDLIDPWNNPIKYEWPTTKGSGKKPAIWSMGPDGEDNQGGGDDIISWDPQDMSGQMRAANNAQAAGFQNGVNPNMTTGMPGMNTMDPSMTGGMPGMNTMDPSMTGGMPGMNTMDPSMTGGMPGMNTMDPSMTGGMPGMNTGVPNNGMPQQQQMF